MQTKHLRSYAYSMCPDEEDVHGASMYVAFIIVLDLWVLRFQLMNCLHFALQKEVSEITFQQVNSSFVGSGAEPALQGV